MNVTTLLNMASRLINILLGLTLLGWVFFAYAWRSQLHLAQEEIEALKTERAAMHRRIADLENARKTAPASSEVQEADGRENKRTGRSGPAAEIPVGPTEIWRGGGGPGRFFSMMEKPEVQRLLGIQQKAALDSRFASLFQSLNLSPADLDKFKNLLVEKQTASMDAVAAARAQGLTGPENRDAVHEAIVNAQAEVDNSIRSTLGDAAFAQYQTYEQTLPERNVVTQLQQRLSYSSSPLTDAQSDQIIALLAANAPQSQKNSGPPPIAIFSGGNVGFGTGPFRGGGGVPITDGVIAGSQGILNNVQIAALTQLQQEQQAQAQLAAQMRAGRQAAAPTVPMVNPNPTPIPAHP